MHDAAPQKKKISVQLNMDINNKHSILMNHMEEDVCMQSAYHGGVYCINGQSHM